MGNSPKSRNEETHGEGVASAATWLIPEQVAKLKRHSLRGRYNEINQRNHASITLMYDTGIRVGEFVALDLGNLRLEANPPELYLQPAIQKGRAPPAYLDLAEETATELERYLSSRPWDTEALFPSRQATRATTESIRRAVTRAAERAEIRPYLGGVGTEGVSRGEPSKVTPHTLRHSLAYRMIRDEGKRMVDVQRRLRHAYLDTTTRIYGHLRRR